MVTANTMDWASLPEDIISHIMEFWSHKLEMKWKRIVHLIDRYHGIITFRDPNTYLTKLMTFSKPSHFSSFDLNIPTYRFTKECLIVSHKHGPDSRFNFKKYLHKYHSYLQTDVIGVYKRITWYFMRALCKNHDEYHAMYKRYCDERGRKLC